jgi:hypothetical protein
VFGLLVAGSVGAGGCASCDDYASASLTVSVVDSDGSPVCDAIVTAVDGNYVFDLEPSGGADCTFSGPWERGGSYIVEAKRGDATGNQAVEVGTDACGVKPELVSIMLEG